MWTWDEAKRRSNLAKHAVDFAAAEDFDWTTAVAEPDDRTDYGERRIEVTGMIGARLHVLILTPRGADYRIISLRKANSREQGRWERLKR